MLIKDVSQKTTKCRVAGLTYFGIINQPIKISFLSLKTTTITSTGYPSPPPPPHSTHTQFNPPQLSSFASMTTVEPRRFFLLRIWFGDQENHIPSGYWLGLGWCGHRNWGHHAEVARLGHPVKQSKPSPREQKEHKPDQQLMIIQCWLCSRPCFHTEELVWFSPQSYEIGTIVTLIQGPGYSGLKWFSKLSKVTQF